MDYLVVSNIASHGVGPAVNRSMPYDPLRDFTQIGLIVAVPSALGVTRDGKYETLAQFLTAARASGNDQGRFFRQPPPAMPRPRCCRAWRGSSCCTCRIAVRRRRCWTSWPATAGRSICLGCCRPVARGIPVSPDLIADRARRAAELPRDHADAPAVTLPQLDDHTVHSRQPSSLNCHRTTVNLPGERSCSLRMLNPPRLVNSR